jgi:hypothetical protein
MVNLEKKTKNYNKQKDAGVFDESEGLFGCLFVL